jgi:hypothetical protein
LTYDTVVSSRVVRLAEATPEQLRELLEDAWRRVAPERMIAAYEKDAGR